LDRIRNEIGTDSEKSFNNLLRLGESKQERGDKMRWMKHCPECGSTHLAPDVFYRPSIWRCSDCGYEGAFIIEGDAFAERTQESNLRISGTVGRPERGLREDVWDDPTEDWRKILGG
jgi:ribosomal protein L37AE/L43A